MKALTRDEAIEKLRTTIERNNYYDKEIAEAQAKLKEVSSLEEGIEH